MRLWIVKFGNIVFICESYISLNDREDVKRKAHRYIGGNSDDYIVEPLTDPGDRIHLDLSIAV